MRKRRMRILFGGLFVISFLVFGCAGAPRAAAEESASEIPDADVARITPKDARARVKAGKALLVCAYPEEWTFQDMRLEGAISLKTLEKKLPSVSKDQEIIFYCA